MADADFTHRETSAWVAGTTSVLPTYPTDVSNGTTAADDIVYLTVVAKPDTTTITPSGSWTPVEELTGGSGSVGADTGPTKTGIWKRSVPGGGLTSTTTVTLTGASVAMACISNYRPVTPGTTTWTEDAVGASKAASSDLALTASAAPSIAIADGRHVAAIVASPSDTSTTQPVSTIAASGATIGTPAAAPGSDFTAQGNDLAASRYDAEVTAGTSSSAPSITGTAASSTTRHVVWLVIRAEQTLSTTGALAGTAPQATGALTGNHIDTGALAGTAPQATGALAGVVRTTGALAGTAPQATGALAGVVRTTGALAGIAPQVAAALSGVVRAAGALAGSAPQAVGALAGEVRTAGALAGLAPVAVGALDGFVDTGETETTGTLAGVAPRAVGALEGRHVVDGQLAGQAPRAVGTLTDYVTPVFIRPIRAGTAATLGAAGPAASTSPTIATNGPSAGMAVLDT